MRSFFKKKKKNRGRSTIWTIGNFYKFTRMAAQAESWTTIIFHNDDFRFSSFLNIDQDKKIVRMAKLEAVPKLR